MKLPKPIEDLVKVDKAERHPWVNQIGVYFEICTPKEADLLVRTLSLKFPNGFNTIKVGYALMKEGVVVDVGGHYSLVPQIGDRPTKRGLFMKKISKAKYVNIIKSANRWLERCHPELNPIPLEEEEI